MLTAASEALQIEFPNFIDTQANLLVAEDLKPNSDRVASSSGFFL